MDAIKKIKDPKIRLIAVVIAVIVAAITIFSKSDLLADEPKNSPDSIPENELIMTSYFIDVGQGDCSLFVSGDETMLIDSGEYEYGDAILSFMEEKGISEIDYIVATHAHTDHMGAMKGIINSIDVENIILSEVSDSAMSKRQYGEFLEAVDNSGAEVIIAEPDYTFSFGNAECTILAPFEVSQDENNNSVVIKIMAGKTSFLMTGDIEKSVEKQILINYPDLEATILKIAHHGSNTSSHDDFINSINAKVGIISVGKSNSYDHPSAEVIESLRNSGMDLYRTDLNGTVTIECAEDRYKIFTEK